MQEDRIYCHCGFSSDIEHLWAGHVMRCPEALEINQRRRILKGACEGHVLRILGIKPRKGYYVDRRGGRIYSWIVQCETCFTWGEHRGDTITETSEPLNA